MAAPVASVSMPQFISKGTYGTLYRNFGSEPHYVPEPDVMTKFFLVGTREFPAKYSYEEKEIHERVTKKFITQGNEILNIIIGNGKPATVKEQERNGTKYPENRYAPGDEKDYKPGAIRYFINILNQYNVLKLPYLGVNLWGSSNRGGLNLNLNIFIKTFETLILFHTAFIHNDVKMNNILYNPVNNTVSIIDLATSKKFVPSKNPWPTNAFQFHFTHPPDYISTRGIDAYTGYFNSITSDTKLSHDYYTLGLNQWIDNPNSVSILNAVWNDYFASPVDAKRLLWVGVTGDLYGLGISLRYSIRDVDPAVLATEYLLGYNPDGTENRKSTEYIIKVLQFLICHIHPRMRPLDYIIVKYFKILNSSTLGHEGKTTITIDDDPYTDISILNGAIPSINMPSGMAYGMPGSPITADDLKENMLIFAYLLSKSVDELTEYFNTEVQQSNAVVITANGNMPNPIRERYIKLIFANVYADADAYFQQGGFQGVAKLIELGIITASAAPASASAAPPSLASLAAPALGPPVDNSLPARLAASAASPPSLAAPALGPPVDNSLPARLAASALTPLPQVLPNAGSKKKHDGGMTKYRRFRKSRRFNLTKKRGGRVQPRNLVKVRSVRPLEKSNNTRRNKAVMYGEYQNDLIKYQLLISRPSGIINVLYKYYLSLSKKPTDDIFRLLLQINEFERDKLPIIQEMCASGKYGNLKEYLEENFTLNNRDDIDEIIEKYYGFESDDERFYYLNNLGKI